MPRILAILLLLLMAPKAFACLSAGPPPTFKSHTLEALTADSSAIVIATVRSTSAAHHNCWQLQLDTIETLKSATPLPATITTSLTNQYPCPTPGTQVLCFFNTYAYIHPYAPGCDFYTRDLIPLDQNAVPRSYYAPLIRDLTLEPIASTAKVLELVRAEINRDPPTSDITWFYSVAPFELCCLPADDRLLPAARQWATSPNPHARYFAVQVFAKHPDPQDVPFLYSLLNDPFTADEPFGISPWSGHEFVIRQIAFKALNKQGLTVPATTTLFLPHNDLYQPFDILPFALLLVVAMVGFGVLRHLRRKRLQLPRPSLTQSTIAYLTFLNLCLTIPTLFLWHRSLHTADDLVYASQGKMTNLYSAYGYLAFEHVKNWPAETPLVHFSFTFRPISEPTTPPHSFRHGFFHERALGYECMPLPWLAGINLDHRANDWPFWKRIGTHPSRSSPGFAVVIYYGWLLILFLLLPAIRLLISTTRRLRHHFRTRRALAKKLCLNCSYDLRAHFPGQRCPECGTTIVRDL